MPCKRGHVAPRIRDRQKAPAFQVLPSMLSCSWLVLFSVFSCLVFIRSIGLQFNRSIRLRFTRSLRLKPVEQLVEGGELLVPLLTEGFHPVGHLAKRSKPGFAESLAPLAHHVHQSTLCQHFDVL